MYSLYRFNAGDADDADDVRNVYIEIVHISIETYSCATQNTIKHYRSLLTL